MKKLATMLLCGMLVFSSASISVSAASLDDVIGTNQQQNTEVEQGNTGSQTPVDNGSNYNATTNSNNSSGNAGYVTSDDFIGSLQNATDLTGHQEVVENAKPVMNKVAAIIVQILSYLITIGLTIRVVLDLTYIVLPFTRSFLSNGYMGNAQAGAGGMPNSMGGMGGMGGMSGGMGMGGMNGMGGYGMRGGMGGYGMHGGMGGMGGMNGMGGMQQGMQGGMNNQNMSHMGAVQWVSNAALNAVAAESQPGPDGKAVSPFKLYIKDMVVIMILTPILLALALTGTLTDLGFLLGDVICAGINSIGGMF